MDIYLGTIVIWSVDWIPVDFQKCDGTLLNVNANQALFSVLGTTYGGDGSATFGVPDLRGRVPLGAGVSVTGETYTFAKPGGDENVTVPIGIPPRTPLGTASGSANGSVVLTTAQLPVHAHAVNSVQVPVSIPANNAGGTTDTPANNTVHAKATVVGGPVNTTAKSYSTAAPNVNLASFDLTIPASTTSNVGNGSPVPVSLNVIADVTSSSNGIDLSGSASIMQPYLPLHYIICVNGIYPPKP